MVKITFLTVDYKFKSFSLNDYKPLTKEATYNVRNDNNTFDRGESNDVIVPNRKVELSFKGYADEIKEFKELLENDIRIETFTILIDRVDLFNTGDFGASHDVKCVGIRPTTRDDLYFDLNFTVYKI